MAKRGMKQKSQGDEQVTIDEGGVAVAERPKRGRKPAAESNGDSHAESDGEDSDAEEKPRRRRRQQDLIPDAFERIPEIEAASEDLDRTRTKRIKLLGQEVEQEKQLAEIMQKHGRDVYKYDQKTVIRKHSEKDKVTIKTDDEEAED
jgi:hypothetical protein